MKITLTKPELLAVLTDHFGREVTECTITKPARENYFSKIEDLLMKQFGTSNLSELSTRKIEAIKLMREIVPGMGLAEAKWAVEHWNQWSAVAKKEQRAPRFTQDTGWDSMRVS